MDDKHSPDLKKLFAGLARYAPPRLGAGSNVVQDKQFIDLLASYDPIRLAATLGALLTVPDLQSNCIRLEALVHFSLAYADGGRKPNSKIIERLYSVVGDALVDLKEDPAEDVFVANISTPRGNFHVLEGVWESGGFHLQLALNVMEAMPTDGGYENARKAIYALLGLSDAVCESARLSRNQLGNGQKISRIPIQQLEGLSDLRRIVTFTQADLAGFGVSREDLSVFVFDPAGRAGLGSETVGQDFRQIMNDGK